MDARYDVAISFLSRDEPLAVKLHNELREYLQVFVYSKRQEELAGTDGLESFRKTFLSDSKLVVVLYRNGWGKTRWTAIEENCDQGASLQRRLGFIAICDARRREYSPELASGDAPPIELFPIS